MNIKINFNTEEEKEEMIKKYSNLYLIKVAYLINEKYLIFTDNEPVVPIILDDIVKEQGNKISILEAENADLLLDSAIKDSKISTLENDLADLTLEIAMMEVR